MIVALGIATVVGFLLTAINLVAAFFSARRELDKADDRIAWAERLHREERETMNARTPGQVTSEVSQGIHEEFTRRYAEHDLTRPSQDNLTRLAIFETRRLIGLVLDSTRSNLVWAGVGLLISTLASLGSLFY